MKPLGVSGYDQVLDQRTASTTDRPIASIEVAVTKRSITGEPALTWNLQPELEAGPSFRDGVVRAAAATWDTWPGTGLTGRDLELGRLTAGALMGQQVRAMGDEAGPADWHCYDLDFEVLYVIAGRLLLEAADHSVHHLQAGSCFFHPAFHLHRDLYRSGDLDVLRITSSADGRRFEGRDGVPEAVRRPSTSAVYLHGLDQRQARGTDQHGLPGADRRHTQARMRVLTDEDVFESPPANGRWVFVLDGISDVVNPDAQRINLQPGDSLSSSGGPDNGRIRSEFSKAKLLELTLHTGDP